MQRIISGKDEPKGKKPKPEIPLLTETQIQIQCIDWFARQYRKTYEAGLLIHIANERHCSMRRGNELKKMGVRRGVPDLQLMVARQGFHGLFIEMKAKGRYPRPEQRVMMGNLEREGYKCVVCHSLKEFMQIINDYLA